MNQQLAELSKESHTLSLGATYVSFMDSVFIQNGRRTLDKSQRKKWSTVMMNNDINS
jgi:hypothetical protein